jgi:RHS repeat-associated protein
VGELTSVTDPAGNKTAYEYDDQARLVKTTNAAGKEKRSNYNSRGNLASTTDFAGVQTTFGYDAKDRLNQITVGSKTVALTYNAAGQIETATDENGVTRYTYDTVDRLTSEQKPDGATLSYEYDSAGRIKKLVTPYRSTANTYDTLGRLKTVTDKDGTVTNYEYDANGNQTKVAYSNGMTTTYTYNAVNALVGERITDKTNTLVREYVYTVGDAGERLQVQESNNRAVTYTYDALYRLTGETVTENAATTNTTYAYDSVSNRVSKNVGGVVTSYSYNNLNQLTGETGITYQYDLNGNRVKKIEGARTTTYTFDEFNRLSRATIQEGANVAVEEYGYDWRGNRIRKSRELDTVKYLVDTNNWISHVVAETDGTGALKAFYTRGGDTLISMNRGGVKSYYLFDGHGSVRMLANESNFITDTWNFDAYGEIMFSTGVTENDYLYAGERFDRTTELYHLRARYMDPKTGTFMSMDTYQGNMHDPISLHKYMYANANPISNSDPTGMWTVGEMLDTLHIQSILNGSGGLNYALIFNMLKSAGHAIQFASSMKDLVVGFFAGDLKSMVLAVANGAASVVGMMDICESHMAVQLLTKALAVYGVKENAEAFLKAAKEGDVSEMLISGLNITLDVISIFAACFDGDTLVAAEYGFKRIDEIQVGDQVWSYNVETGEKSLKEVKQVFVKESDEILHLETTEGEIDATTNHPFYVTGKGWVAAGDLVVGDEVHTLSGDTDTVTGFKLTKLDKPISVYNLEIEDFQTYFIEDLLVHNKCTWLKKLRDQGQKVPDGMVNPHGHHILFKVGIGEYQQRIVKIGQKILRSVGIDPIEGLENLVIADNVAEVHTRETLVALFRDLWVNRHGGYDVIVEVLKYHGHIVAGKR